MFNTEPLELQAHEITTHKRLAFHAKIRSVFFFYFIVVRYVLLICCIILTGPLLLYTERATTYNPQPADANMEGSDQTARSVRVFFGSTKMSTSFLRESRHAKRENIAERLCES